MKTKKHPIRNTSIVLGTALVLIEAFNRFVFHLMDEKSSLSCEEGSFHDFSRGRFFYKKIDCSTENEEKEKKDPILLIHELSPAASADCCEELARQLSKKRTVYTMDLLGCGRSAKPPITYVNFLYVLQVSEMVREIIGRPVHLVAEKNSGAIAIAAARYSPDLISRITLLNPTALENEKKIPDTRSRIAKKIIESPIIGSLIYHIAFSKSTSAHMGGETARYLYASMTGFYTHYDVDWMLGDLDIPVKTVRSM